MRNRNNPVPLRQPLLAALDKEYAEASRHKDLGRMAEISAAVEALTNLWAPATPTAPAPEAPAVTLVAVPEEEEPPAVVEMPEVRTLPAAPGNRMTHLSVGDILRSVAPMPGHQEADQHRRATAKGRLKDAVLRVASTTVAGQVRYELAMQALNRNIEVMKMFAAEAASLGTTVASLAEQIVTQRRAQERRIMHAHAVLARVSAEIDRASGDGIDQAADVGIAEIEGMEA